MVLQNYALYPPMTAYDHIASGPPLEVCQRSQNTFAAEFVGSSDMNLLPAQWNGDL